MALSAKPVFMEVRPFAVSNLCFEVGGILAESRVTLGLEVAAFDFRALYEAFRKAEPPGDGAPSGKNGLTFDSTEIDRVASVGVIDKTQSAFNRAALARLRAEPLRAALDKAILLRANAFITKYGGVAPIAAAMRQIIPAKGTRITRLSGLSSDMANVLNAAYEGSRDTSGQPDRLGAVSTSRTDAVSLTAPAGTDAPTDKTKQDQTIINKSVEFRAPIFENRARDERSQISLGQESISFVMESHYLDRFEEVYANELAAIDADVNRMQVAYLNTILMPPYEGIITGIYKSAGDYVSAGEPVYRLENNALVRIVANVVCRGPVLIGQLLSITGNLFEGSGPPVNISATIVAARGQGDDDQWEVIGEVFNDDGKGKKIFPLGYRFDIDNTQVTIFEPGEG